MLRAAGAPAWWWGEPCPRYWEATELPWAQLPGKACAAQCNQGGKLDATPACTIAWPPGRPSTGRPARTTAFNMDRQDLQDASSSLEFPSCPSRESMLKHPWIANMTGLGVRCAIIHRGMRFPVVLKKNAIFLKYRMPPRRHSHEGGDRVFRQGGGRWLTFFSSGLLEPACSAWN